MKRQLDALVMFASIALVGGCAGTPPKPYDYAAYRASNPSSMLVLPPLNESPEVDATPVVWSHATRPLAEAGYYVLPVVLVDQTLKQNGIQTASDAQGIPVPKLREVFGADAAVYIKVKQYGSSYKVVASETRVDVEAVVVDLRNGAKLWEGKAFATSAEQSQQNQGGIAGLLIAAIVRQVVDSATDAAYNYAGIADARLFSSARPNGILPGPRSPAYKK